jgi:hypothetical protein
LRSLRIVTAGEVLVRRERLPGGEQQLEPVRRPRYELLRLGPLPLGAFAQVVDLVEQR